MLTKGNVSAGATYQYPVQGAAAVRPHAVKSIPSVGDFIYDLNGNLESGAGRTTSWSSFDMPLKIVNGTSVSGFVYGPEHQRTYQCKAAGTSCVNGSGIVYADRQEVEVKNGQTTVKTYWPDGLGLEIDKTDQSGQPVTELNWTHVDRLGSPVLITDANGNVREKLAYDTWGKRRNHDASLAGGSVTPNTLDGVTDNKGYTGHEMLDDLDLVHMNGRLYDPMIGKFMSGEPLVQDPINGQSYNRYSYVLNNPTNLTDPTGFRPELIDVTGSAIPAKTPEEAEARAQGLGTQVMVFREPSKPSSSQPTVNQAGTAQVDAKKASTNTAAKMESHIGMGADGVPFRYEGPAAQPKTSFEKFKDAAGDFGGEVLRLAEGIPGEGVVVGGMTKLVRGVDAADNFANIERVFVQGNKELPAALKGGEATVHVYDGVKSAEPVYVGITNNIAA